MNCNTFIDVKFNDHLQLINIILLLVTIEFVPICKTASLRNVYSNWSYCTLSTMVSMSDILILKN